LKFPHKPVMVNEVTRILMTALDGTYVDGTVGSGGHSEAIGRRLSEGGRLICMDMDSEALRISKERLSFLAGRVTLMKANFADMESTLEDLGIKGVQGVLLDLGMSSYQLDHSGRGFSFNRDEPLDMRMDLDNETDARQIINTLSADEIKRILRNYGEEKKAGLISKRIVRERAKDPIKSSLRLANLVRSMIPPSHRPGSKDPATRTFQALRIAVNRELENLKRFLENVPRLVKKGGRLVVITYHSLEDRMVKHAIKDWAKGCTCPPDLPECVCGKSPLFKRVNPKGLKAGAEEVNNNPRARSAVLRAAERI
jgi:16S rRNA (cytosine1402-N4)-methyltransferase